MKHSTVRKRIGVLVAAVLVIALAGCERENGISSDQAEEAFIVAFGGAYVGSMAAQVGQSLPGVSLDEENQAVSFDEFDVSELQTDYQTLSGTVTTSGETADVDFTLTGGPVETIAFEVNAEQMSSEDGITATAMVNGTEMEITIQPDASLE
ncbi:MAG: hypothetical protein ACOC7V_11735 [Spirochaetota bacterium]